MILECGFPWFFPDYSGAAIFLERWIQLATGDALSGYEPRAPRETPWL